MKKRICAVILSLLLALNLAGVPKARAVVSEGALLGSIFGSLLVSMGFSWAADNMDVPTFGEAIYKLIQEHDEANKDTGVQLIRDLNIAALLSGRPGTIQFNYAWTNAARSFAEWFQEKFFKSSNSSVVSSSDASVRFVGGTYPLLSINQTYPLENNNVSVKTSQITNFSGYSWIDVSPGSYSLQMSDAISMLYSLGASEFQVNSSLGNVWTTSSSSFPDSFFLKIGFTVRGNYVVPVVYSSLLGNPYVLRAQLSDYSHPWPTLADVGIAGASSLSAEKPAEVHYPEVAEDGSQVYEVTYDGVTSTDIEGIIQGAVDRILAGTASIAGEVTQAQDVPVEPEAPAAGEYAVSGLETIFPFCIPFDIYAFCSALNADPVAPSFEWRMQYAPLDLDYTFVIDLEAFDGAARVLRTMELLAFCVGLAFWTRHLIRG